MVELIGHMTEDTTQFNAEIKKGPISNIAEITGVIAGRVLLPGPWETGHKGLRGAVEAGSIGLVALSVDTGNPGFAYLGGGVYMLDKLGGIVIEHFRKQKEVREGSLPASQLGIEGERMPAWVLGKAATWLTDNLAPTYLGAGKVPETRLGGRLLAITGGLEMVAGVNAMQYGNPDWMLVYAGAKATSRFVQKLEEYIPQIKAKLHDRKIQKKERRAESLQYLKIKPPPLTQEEASIIDKDRADAEQRRYAQMEQERLERQAKIDKAINTVSRTVQAASTVTGEKVKSIRSKAAVVRVAASGAVDQMKKEAAELKRQKKEERAQKQYEKKYETKYLNQNTKSHWGRFKEWLKPKKGNIVPETTMPESNSAVSPDTSFADFNRVEVPGAIQGTLPEVDEHKVQVQPPLSVQIPGGHYQASMEGTAYKVQRIGEREDEAGDAVEGKLPPEYGKQNGHNEDERITQKLREEDLGPKGGQENGVQPEPKLPKAQAEILVPPKRPLIQQESVLNQPTEEALIKKARGYGWSKNDIQWALEKYSIYKGGVRR